MELSGDYCEDSSIYRVAYYILDVYLLHAPYTHYLFYTFFTLDFESIKYKIY